MRTVWPALIAAGLSLSLSGNASAQQLRGAVDDEPPIDWSIALRGQVGHDGAGTHVEAIVAPEVSLKGRGKDSSGTLAAGGEFSLDTTGLVRIDALRAGGETEFKLDRATSLRGSLDLSLTQLRPDDSSLPTNTAIAPLEFTGTGEGEVKRNFGRFDVTATLKAERFIEGPTTLDDSTIIDNANLSYWLGDATLRLGYEVTPLLSAFVEAGDSYQKFDAPNPTLLKFLDGRTTTLRTGVSYTMGPVATAEGSIGYGWLDYTDPNVTDAPALVTDASLTFTPGEQVEITGGLNTTLGPSDTVIGDTDVETSVTATAKYRINTYFDLRGSANASRTLTVGTGDVGYGYGFGAGFDLATSRHAQWTGDYSFGRTFTPPGPAVDTHTLSVGLKISN